MAKPQAFSVTDRVLSATYGQGTITHMDEKYTTIEFDENGKRKFLTALVQLEKSDSPAPVKPERTKKSR
jgi:hypothetical protein